MRKKILPLSAMLLLASLLSIAQVKVLTGRVTDQQGQAVAFASVKVKGQAQGVSADADGRFSIRAKAGDVLTISGTGYASQDVSVGDAPTISIQIARSTASLTEVVVTALGQSTNKAKLGYKATTVSSATINRNGAVGMLDNLQGKVAGAEISQVGGPGSSTKVVLRGYGVIAGGNNQPLYVIDGVPLSDGQFQPTSGNLNPDNDTQDFGNGMNNINPNDIESITVLQGTAASSLYGGLAKNGAIMITTKRGRAGKLHIDVSSSANFSLVGKLPDYQTEFGQGWGGVFVPGENGSWGPRLDGKQRLWGSIVDNSQLLKPFSPIKNNLRDFYNTGTEYNNSISLSGGSDVTRFYFSYSNVTSDGVVPTRSDYLERNTFALRTNSNFGNFSINSSFNYVNQNLNIPAAGQSVAAGGGIFQSLLQIPVDIPIKDLADYKNKFFNTDNYFTPYAENPYWGLNENGNNQKNNRFFGNLDFGYKFSPFLSAELRVGADFTNANTFTWKNVAVAKPGTWDGPNPTNTEGFSRTPDKGEVSTANDFLGVVNSDLILKFSKDLNKDFSLDALVGGNYYQNNQTSAFTQVVQLAVPNFYNLSNTSSPPTTANGYLLQRRMGAYAQATLSYKDQLYFTGNIRDDWSSTLPSNHNSIFYPGANVSWVASQNFTTKNVVSYLKLRAAYGRTGSDPNPYLIYPRLGTGTVQLPFGTIQSPFNGVSAFGVSNTINSPDLKPIFTDELELGAEVRFLKDRIGLDATVYEKKTKGQIFSVPIAPSTGYSFLVENLGTVSNKGVELTLNVKPVETKDFNWSFTYLFTRNINNVDNLTGSSQNPLLTSAYDAELRAVVGKTVASIYAPVPQMTPDGKVVVDAATGLPSLNQTPLDANGLTKGYYGSGLYDYTMGFQNTFSYKDFALSFSLDFRHGGVMYSQTADMVMFDGNSVATVYNDRKPFIVPNSVNAITDNSGKTTYVENKTYVGSSGNGETDVTYTYYYPAQNQGSGYANRIFDRSFLKLRDVTLSYRLPQAWASKIGAGYASLSAYGRNFLLWTPKANVFVDPEASNLGNDLLGQLGEFSTAPLTKSYGVILKIGF